MLQGKCVVVGVTGGIAAYKAAEVVSRLKKLRADVVCIMTAHAQEFLAPLTLQSLCANPVVTDMFAAPPRFDIEHIALAQRADLFLVAPASANVIAKMAAGLADDMLSTTLLATKAPVLIAPAMNTGMWTHGATKANMAVLRERGVHVVGPDAGLLACGDVGEGRMAQPQAIVEAACALLCGGRDLSGVRVLVTAGPTREPLDPVRYLTNKSSGKMGFAIARAAWARGADVTLAAGPTDTAPPEGVRVLRFTTTRELLGLMQDAAPGQDIVIQAAAPADFRPASEADQKIKKTGDQPLTLTLVQNPDVAATIGRGKRPGQVFVAFAAETGDGRASARGKLLKKNADMVVLNDVTRPGAGFDVDTNIAVLVTADGEDELPLMSKDALADVILTRAAALRSHA